MTREEYLQWKFCSGKPWCKALRIGVFAFAGVILVGVLYNLGMLLWSLIKLAGAG